MRLTVLLAHLLLILGGIELLVIGLTGYSASAFIFGDGSFAQALYYCFVGVAGAVVLFFLIIFKPFKKL